MFMYLGQYPQRTHQTIPHILKVFHEHNEIILLFHISLMIYGRYLTYIDKI